ncbi:hypothetical protein SASPL_109511 [Salvia splendens]|uniref:DUF7795 domain-containing protein n=1 Tax=Salvia splendens TaxID=180675 RepID=A0A8X9A6D9_SALSN|nr:hypothetical protein SASPL_109511 [Salvia splendens]
MGNEEHVQRDSKEKISAIYSDFMMKIAHFDGLRCTASCVLVRFQQALGRPPIDKTSTLVERNVNAHGSRKVMSYFEAVFSNNHDRVQNVGKSFVLCKSKDVLDELESLLGKAASVVQTSNDNNRVDNSSNSVLCIASTEQTANEKDEKCIVQGRPDLADSGSMMAIVYSMLKQDYTMQARIVCSLSHKFSQEELEIYCQMWSLRPFVDDDIMRKAWNFFPGR